jgi:hypothetical protein
LFFFRTKQLSLPTYLVLLLVPPLLCTGVYCAIGFPMTATLVSSTSSSPTPTGTIALMLDFNPAIESVPYLIKGVRIKQKIC